MLAQVAAALETIALGVVQWGAATSTGRRRSINEDVWGHRDDVFTVADGMGGRGGGAVAARIATDRFLDAAVAVPRRGTWHDIVAAVSDEVARAGAAQAMARLGTTLLAAIIEGSIVTLVHLGDGRAYRYVRSPATQAAAGRSLAGAHSLAPGDGSGKIVGRLEVLTQDHDVRSELLAAGLDAREYRERGVALHGLTSFIGLPLDVLRVDVIAVPVRAGDRLLLCTDGVHRHVEEADLRAAMASVSCQQAADRLVAAADDTGGRDNATAVVFEIGAVAR